MRYAHLLAAAACAALSLPLSAQTLKPGLWEISNKSNNPQMDKAMADMQKQMASMPAAQRKQMEQMMAQQGVKLGQGKGGVTTVQMCMTKEMVERNDMHMGQSDCKVTRQERSGNTMRMAYTCPNPPSSGEGEFTYLSSEAYKSRMTVKSTVGGKTETTTMEGSGKWLSADCGKVKPIAPPKK